MCEPTEDEGTSTREPYYYASDVQFALQGEVIVASGLSEESVF